MTKITINEINDYMDKHVQNFQSNNTLISSGIIFINRDEVSKEDILTLEEYFFKCWAIKKLYLWDNLIKYSEIALLIDMYSFSTNIDVIEKSRLNNLEDEDIYKFYQNDDLVVTFVS